LLHIHVSNIPNCNTLHSTHCFILFYFILYFILFYFTLFYFILFYFILFYFILFYFILFYFILFYFTLFYVISHLPQHIYDGGIGPNPKWAAAYIIRCNFCALFLHNDIASNDGKRKFFSVSRPQGPRFHFSYGSDMFELFSKYYWLLSSHGIYCPTRF
jgi:hypothetical protein